MSAGEVAGQFGVSRRTVYKWLARFRAGGEAALENRISRPRRSSRRLPVERVAVIAALRRRRMSGLRITLTLSLPISSVSLELRRLGLNRLPRLEARPKVVRHEHEAPGDMIHLDIKKLGKIDGIGHRITGDRSKRQLGAGWEYLHVCVDGHSRLAYSEVLPDERASSDTGFLIRAADRPGRLQKGASTGTCGAQGRGQPDPFCPSGSLAEAAWDHSPTGDDRQRQMLCFPSFPCRGA